MISLPATMLEAPHDIKIDNDFKTHILAKFIDNDVGRLCRKDKTIIKLGSVFYRRIRRKWDKAVQVRKTVRIEMRRLGNLYLIFTKQQNIIEKKKEAHDMFLRCNFEALRDAIDIYSVTSEGKLKPGLKQNLLFLLKRSAKALKAILMSNSEDDEAREIESFVQVLELWEDFVFGDAQYELNKRRQINLRRPENLPNEDDVQLVRQTVIASMKSLTSDPFLLWDDGCYIKLRDSACTRLTLLNARRGGEPARLTIDEWDDARKDNWIDKQRLQHLDELDMHMVKTLKVTYVTGKGNNHLVPILIPDDTIAALTKLSDPEVRKQAGILELNNYLFPSTRNSEIHVSGWHSLHNVCDNLPLKDPTNMKSTSNRRRSLLLTRSLLDF